MKMKNCFIHILVAIFGSGSWLAINGIFSELSFLVQTAPESWNLASGLVLTIQLGNIIPLAYVLLGKLVTYKHTETPVIYAILAVGCISSILLGFLWSNTVEFWGESRSLFLYMFTFSLAAVDCFSSITYFPFMARFPEKFIVSLMIGEGLSGFMPSVLALAQNGGTVRVNSEKDVGDGSFSPSADNLLVSTSAPSSNTTTSSWCQTQANFSEEVYFFLIFVLFLLSGIAFFVLNFMYSWITSPRVVSLDSDDGPMDVEDRQYGVINAESEKREYLDPYSGPLNDISASTSENRSSSESDIDSLTFPTLRSNNDNGVLSASVFSFRRISKIDVLLFSSLFIVCFLFNGALPSVSTYILLPYGNEYMLIVSNIANIANPLTCTLMIFIPFVTSINISTLSTLVSSAISIVLLVFAAVSPPWTENGDINGQLVTAVLWVLFKIIATVARVVQANICRSRGTTYLFLYGVVTQIGSFCGALLFYYLCNYTSVFVPAYADC